ncbi:MAG: hypothetical protein ACM3U2_10965 [Deltaproteobacteria bacterium]
MDALLKSLSEVGHSLWDLLGALFTVLLPWTPLAAWIVFWLFAVNWVRLRETLARGGWVGLVLIGAVMVLVWGSISPGAGTFDFFGLHVSNFVEKTVYVSGLYVIMFLAGALQLSGFGAGCCPVNEPILIAESHGHDAGHAHETSHAPGHGEHH